MLGVLRDRITLGRLEPMGLQSLAIRNRLDRPQLLSTNRHLSQGAAEIEAMRWEDDTLRGRSKVIVDDRYVITIYVPAGYRVASATVDDRPARVEQKGNLLKVSYHPEATASVTWSITFGKR